MSGEAESRVRIRPIQLADTPLYAALWTDPRVHPWVVDGGPVPLDAVRARMARRTLASARGGPPTWTVLAPGPVGFVALHDAGSELALSYAIAPRHQGRGIALEAVVAVLRGLGADAAVEARTHLDNPASVRLLRAAGFTEGTPTTDRRVFRWTATDPGPVLRRPREGEHVLARRIYRATMAVPTEALLGSWTDQGIETVDAAFAAGEARMIDTGGPVGWLHVVRTDDELVLHHLYVDPAHQGKGTGTRAIRALRARAVEEGRALSLAVLRTNPRARGLYERLGFQVVGGDPHKTHLVWHAPDATLGPEA